MTAITGLPEGTPERGAVTYVDVAFKVHEWFRGGDANEVSVQLFPPRRPTSIGNPDYEVGSRLLVTGEPRWGGEPLDDAVAWYCEFTRTYDAATAEEWREALE